MKIVKSLKFKTLTFYPSGTFIQKINTIAKLFNYTIKTNYDEFFIIPYKSKKRVTGLQRLIRDNKGLRDIVIIYKFSNENKSSKMYHNFSGEFKERRTARSIFLYSETGNKINTKTKARDVVFFALEKIIENYEDFQNSINSKNSEAWPFKSLTFKII